MSKSGSSIQYGWSRPSGTFSSLRRSTGMSGRRWARNSVSRARLSVLGPAFGSSTDSPPTWPVELVVSSARKEASSPVSCCMSLFRLGLALEVAVQPVADRGGGVVGDFEHRRMSDSGEDNGLPAGIAGRGLAHGRHRDQPVVLAADEQDRDVDPGHHFVVIPATGEYPQHGPGGGQEHPGPG